MISRGFLRTLLGMIGGDIRAAGKFDGIDLTAQLTGQAALLPRALCWREKANNQAAIRDGDWKYMRLGGKEHLFNLAEDERERADLALQDPRRLIELRLKWDKWNARMLPYALGSYSEDVRDAYPDRY